MAGTLNTTFVKEFRSKHLKKALYGNLRNNLTDKLLNYNFILGKDTLYECSTIFNFKKKTSLGKKFQFQ